MIEAIKRYKNIFWFLIDGLNPDFIHISGDKDICPNYFDKLLSKGTIFNNVITTNAGTHTSMHSIFTSLLPSYNGATGWEKRALRNFNQKILTITDYLQLAGYETFRYCDADGERTVPMSGFKRWESSGYKIGKVLDNTNLTKTKRRDQFVEDVNACKTSKFVYHHVELLHELNGRLGAIWHHEDYIKNIAITAKEFEKLYNEYIISMDDLVIVSSDHGVILDKDFMRIGEQYGERQYEQSVKSFFALIGDGIESQVLKKPISALDEAPTILHIALNISMPGQGRSQYDYMQKDIYYEDIYFREKGSYYISPELQNSLTSDVYYVRDGKWKYVFGKNDPRCEWLINLEEDEDYQINLKDKYPELAEKYYQILKNKFDGAKSFQYKYDKGLEKSTFRKTFSFVLQMNYIRKETIDSLLDMSGPYYEIIIPDLMEMLEYKEHYKIHIVESTKLDYLDEICRGEWIVFLKENGEWSEYFASDLYHYIQRLQDENIKIVGEHYIAFRKDKIHGFIGRDLFEKDEVRDIKYLHKKVDKKYIIFGCGVIGKQAVEYFGETDVYCFVDNNLKLLGHEVCGKKVISFETLKKIRDNYTIVIAAKDSFAKEIQKQLESNNIYEYVMFNEYII